jgi:hypothetical protein
MTTTVTITDPVLIEQLKAAKDAVEFRDAAGTPIAMFKNHDYYEKIVESIAPCMTEEQLAANRAKGPGRPLREVLAEMKARRDCTKS